MFVEVHRAPVRQTCSPPNALCSTSMHFVCRAGVHLVWLQPMVLCATYVSKALDLMSVWVKCQSFLLRSSST